MADGRLDVDSGAIQGHASNLDEALKNFGKTASEFDDALNEVLGTGMKGGGETGFAGIHQKWMEASEQVKSGLEQMGVKTSDIADAYSSGAEEQRDAAETAGNQMDFHIQKA